MTDLYVTPSTLEVDYDKNLTELYKAIIDQDWDKAALICRRDPVQAATWVVRHYEDDDEIMWRFLPIHSACARQPPAFVIQALLTAYDDGAKCIDDQGMYALHYACGNQASRNVIRQLLVNFPEASKLPDPRGMLPIHYLACWGPSSVSVVDMLLIAHRDIASARDEEGNTPLDLAMEGDYPERDAVVDALKKWLDEEEEEKREMKKHSMRPTPTAIRPATFRSTTNATVRPTTVRPTTIRPTHRLNVEPEEEKKQEDDYAITAPKRAGVSPTQVNRMEEQIRKLQEEIKAKEAEKKSEPEIIDIKQIKQEDNNPWEQKYLDLQKESEQQESMLLKEKVQLEHSLAEMTKALEEAQKELEEKNKSCDEKDKEIEELKKKSESSEEELQGLRITLGDLMEQHDNFKKKSHQLGDRLGSLSVSLEGMLEQQATLSKDVKARNDLYKDVIKKRHEKLQELAELEESMTKDEYNLEGSLAKQMKEMEAISAVIAAARES